MAATAFSQAITIRAWWSSNWWRSSREVYKRVVLHHDGAQSQHRVESDDVLGAVRQDRGPRGRPPAPPGDADPPPPGQSGRRARCRSCNARRTPTQGGCRPLPRTARASRRETPWAGRSRPAHPADSSSPRAAGLCSAWSHPARAPVLASRPGRTLQRRKPRTIADSSVRISTSASSDGSSVGLQGVRLAPRLPPASPARS